MLQPRYYQQDAFNHFFDYIEENHGRHPVIVLPTGCISWDSIVNENRCSLGRKKRIDKMYNAFNGLCKNKKYNYNKQFKTYVRSLVEEKIQLNEIESISYSGIKDLYTLTLENNNFIKATPDHKIMTKEGWKPLCNLTKNDFVMCDTLRPKKKENHVYKKHVSFYVNNLWFHPYAKKTKTKKEKRGWTVRVETHRALYECKINNITLDEYKYILRNDEKKSSKLKFVDPSIFDIHHIDENHCNNDANNLVQLTKYDHQKLHSHKSKHNFNQGIPVFSKVKSIKYFGKDHTYDIGCIKNHNFVANGIVVHNSGKSLLQSMIVSEVLRDHGTRICLVTHRQELIKQNYIELTDHLSGELLDVGIYSAGLDCRDTKNRIIFAGIQSVCRRAWELGHFDLILIDEAHRIPHSTEGTYRYFLTDMVKINPKVIIAGLSATPYRMKTGLLCEGKDKLFDDICHNTTIPELIDPNHFRNRDKKQYLCKIISKNGINKADLTDVHIRGGEYVQGEMENAFLADGLVEKAVKEIIEYTQDRKKVLIFTSGIAHCEAVAEMFTRFGCDARFVHSQNGAENNERTLQAHKKNEFKYLCNVDVLCLDSETEILTSDGFVGIDQMSMNHKIAAWDKDFSVQFTHPITIVKRKRFKKEKMVSFGTTQSANIRVTEDHRMVTYDKYHKTIDVIHAKDLINKRCFVPTSGHCEPIKFNLEVPQPKQDYKQHVRATSFYHRKRGFSEDEAQKFAIEQVNKIRNRKYKNPDELTIDECSFIGFWLGDGSIYRGNKGGTIVSIAQSMIYPDNIQFIENLLNSIGFSYHKKIYPPTQKSTNNSITWTISRGTGGFSQFIKKGFFELEPYLKKTGTKLFHGLTRQQLDALLHGFWLADGLHHAKKQMVRTKSITGTQIELYNCLQEICVLRGISASIKKLHPPKKENHKQSYKFSWGGREFWSYSGKQNIFLESDYKDERVWCVTSTTSFLICRRKGKVFITGNTEGYNDKAIDCIAMLRGTKSPGLYAQIAGRGLRLFPGKENCLFLDFGGNILLHGPIDRIEVRRNKKGKNELATAPSKECPNCHSVVHAAVAICPDCGFVFKKEEAGHDETASSADILSKWKKPEKIDVQMIIYSRHQKQGKPDSMRVSYVYNIDYNLSHNEYICIEHEGFAKKRALAWLAKRIKRPINTVDDALDMKDYFREPKQIIVDLNEKFPKIVGYIFDDNNKMKDIPEAYRPTETKQIEETHYDDLSFDEKVANLI